MEIRRYEEGGDAAGVGRLIEVAYRGDPELGEMVRGLHGADREAPCWRRCVVAVEGGEVVGVGTAALSRHHPGSTVAGVAVDPAHRRRGIGTALLAEVRRAVARFDPPPAFTTVDGRDEAAAAFAAERGFRPGLRYEVWMVDSAGADLPPPVEPPLPLTDMSTVDDETLLDALEAVSAWAHPEEVGVAPTPREVLGEQTLPRLLRDSGVLALADGRTVAMAALAEFGAEPLPLIHGIAPERPRPDAEKLAAAMLARLIPAARRLGRSIAVEVSGAHEPIGAVLARLPTAGLASVHQLVQES